MANMYSTIEAFLNRLQTSGTLSSPQGLDSVRSFASSIEDEDYRAALYGGAGVRLCRIAEYDLAEEMTSLAHGPERASELRRLADELASAGQVERALRLYLLVRETVLAESYSTGIVQEIEQSAKSLAKSGHTSLAISFWDDAVRLAAPNQSSGGHAGLESSGILLWAVEALCNLGETKRAREIAALIEAKSLKERAILLIDANSQAAES